ncbi:MAG: peptidoglycan bridge formation glycyltransferase FemA/FemB family protein, partial [Candidatus Daviesbacteria bacterium]|nr:peptidoglycan bridge formation glycyltransferase FemA/FemB family protein [Candidatus Daviesbacteria bacterium]
TRTEEELLKNMHPKTRYNIKVAQKHGVKVEQRTNDKAFEIYLKLYFETTKRQGYHGHNKDYHRKVWKTLKATGMARLLVASFQDEPLTTWMLLSFSNTLYYPYGGSSKSHPEVMANNLTAWEAIRLGKKMGLKYFDMWGALGPNANPKDPWYGFHKFKQGYGGRLTEYIGSYDLVFNWPLYFAFTLIDKLTPLKLFLLKLLGK